MSSYPIFTIGHREDTSVKLASSNTRPRKRKRTAVSRIRLFSCRRNSYAVLFIRSRYLSTWKSFLSPCCGNDMLVGASRTRLPMGADSSSLSDNSRASFMYRCSFCRNCTVLEIFITKQSITHTFHHAKNTEQLCFAEDFISL